MRAADTNVLVRLIVRDDPSLVLAAEKFVSNGVWVSHLALGECLVVLSRSYKFDASQLAAVVEVFLAHEKMILQDPDVVAAALGHFRRKPSLGFFDCLIPETARKAGHLPL